MKKIFAICTFLFATLVGCIENDLPYPVIIPKITSMVVDGATAVSINSDQRTVTITLSEPSKHS